jgi:UDP-N-acetylglucosamine 1-carboxyvinyltransferase
VLEALDFMGCRIATTANEISLQTTGALKPISLTALPYPGIPTDVQSQLTAVATQAAGQSRITDQVFPERFHHVRELARLGARVRHAHGSAIVRGPAELTGAMVTATDLRASAALVLAGLAANGETIVRRVRHLDRGYERLEQKLAALGATIERIFEHRLENSVVPFTFEVFR